MAGNLALRKELDAAIGLTDGAKYKAEIERLRSVYGHNIRVLRYDYGRFFRGEPEPSCYAYAFGLADNAEYLQILEATQGGDQPLSAAVVTRLLEARNPKIFPRRQVAARRGDVVLYFLDGHVKHGGIIIDPPGRIRSKWGQAEEHKHDLWEVPLSYGHEAVTYLRPSAAKILAQLGA